MGGGKRYNENTCDEALIAPFILKKHKFVCFMEVLKSNKKNSHQLPIDAIEAISKTKFVYFEIIVIRPKQNNVSHSSLVIQ